MAHLPCSLSSGGPKYFHGVIRRHPLALLLLLAQVDRVPGSGVQASERGSGTLLGGIGGLLRLRVVRAWPPLEVEGLGSTEASVLVDFLGDWCARGGTYANARLEVHG